MSIEMITLGGGCFWCTEAVYEHVDGVTAVESGYCNGRVAQPTYEQVCSGATGCVEVIRVAFDADRISLREVLHPESGESYPHLGSSDFEEDFEEP
jgi:peptide-methionine (S)-S-oxide reductase